MTPTTKRLAELFHETGAYREGQFTLTSGATSTFYIDGKLVTHHPEGARVVADAILEVLADYTVDAVGGPETGANAIAVAVAMASGLRNGRPIPAFFVRKQPKGHGRERLIEGLPDNAAATLKRVAIVDDVLTTGKSVVKAIEDVRKAGFEPTVVISVVDREAGAADAMKACGVPYRPLLTLGDIRDASQANSAPAH